VFIELIEFVDNNQDAQILTKVSDVTNFLHTSFSDLETISKQMIENQAGIFINPEFRPMVFNVDQAISAINQVEMKYVQEDSINKFDYKYLKMDENLLRVRLKKENYKTQDQRLEEYEEEDPNMKPSEFLDKMQEKKFKPPVHMMVGEEQPRKNKKERVPKARGEDGTDFHRAADSDQEDYKKEH